jgi:CRP/FNR family transcriptional regulator
MAQEFAFLIKTSPPEPNSLLLNQNCLNCNLNNLCVPIAVRKNEIDRLEEIIKQGKTLNRNEHIFQEHSEFKSIFAVRSGAVKTYTISREGQEQVTGFYLPGEIIGLDSTNTKNYSCSAKALERSSVCEIPFNQLEHLATQIPTLQHHFFQLMSKEIQGCRQLTMLLSNNTAEERVAALLINLSSRFHTRRLSATEFRLPMARNDIGNYLGLAVETVSRVFTRFQANGLISVQGREIKLNDIAGLLAIISNSGKSYCPA